MGGIAVVVMILAGAPVGMAAVSVGAAWVGGGVEDKEQKQGKKGDSFQALHDECLLMLFWEVIRGNRIRIKISINHRGQGKFPAIVVAVIIAEDK